MWEYLNERQIDIMLVLGGIYGMLAVISFMIKSLTVRRKWAFIMMDLSAMLLLNADRCVRVYSGDTSDHGFWMMRIGKFLVFFLIPIIIYTFNMYLKDLCEGSEGIKHIPKRLNIADILIAVNVLTIVISQFTGLYYTIDEMNIYHRSDGYVISYIFPLLVLMMQLSVIVEYRKRIGKLMYISFTLFSVLPIVASFIQVFAYGLSLINITFVGLIAALHFFAIADMNQAIENAHKMEIELLKEEHTNMRRMLTQTASALSNAIDAKDQYTHGHSRRVAEYSQKIAEMAGKSDEECWDIYLTALMHDVGKIGIPDSIINKSDKLTDEEYEVIKTHPIIGKKILKKIIQTPFLSVGANYHHERYDGKGYPEGLKGEEIPEIARLIAVADTYDAMTSKRSYRDPLPQDEVRKAIAEGSGTQFDPKFAAIMLRLIDEDKDYNMKQKDDI